MKLENKVCIVTGGSSGLGLASVTLLKEQKAKVVIVDVNDQGKRVGHELGCDFIKCDISNETEVQDMVNTVVNKYQTINVLVNCAGIIVSQPIITSKSVADSKSLQKALQINVVGTFNCSKYVAKQMSKQKVFNDEYTDKHENGVIINVASIAGQEGQRGQSMYSITKGAILGLTLPMARDLGRFNIRVVTLVPGIFETPMGSNISPKVVEAMNKMTPMGRPGHPKEFALFVESVIRNSYLNGTNLRIDGAIKLGYI